MITGNRDLGTDSFVETPATTVVTDVEPIATIIIKPFIIKFQNFACFIAAATQKVTDFITRMEIIN